MALSLTQQLLEAYQRASANGGAIELVANDIEIGISIPKGSSVATIDKMVADACDRLERRLDNEAAQ